MASKIMELILKAQDQTGTALKSAESGVTSMNKAVQSLNALALVQMAKKIADVVVEATKIAAEMVKVGSEALATRDRLVAFAGGAERADAMLEALNRASDNTLDRMGAMAMASQMMELGLASTTSEMEIAGAMVARLGKATLSTEGRMNSLTMLLANQSKRRLDDFGLSVEKVTARQKILEAQGMSTEQAFKTAVFEEATAKLGILGDQSEKAATQVAQVESAWEDLKLSLSEELAAEVGVTGVLAATAMQIRAELKAVEQAKREFAESVAEGTANLELLSEQYILTLSAMIVKEMEAAQALGVRVATMNAAAAAQGGLINTTESYFAVVEQGRLSEKEAQALVDANNAKQAEIWEQRMFFIQRDAEATRMASYEKWQLGQQAIENEQIAASQRAAITEQMISQQVSAEQRRAQVVASIMQSLAALEASHAQRMENITNRGGGGGRRSLMSQIAKAQSKEMAELQALLDERDWQKSLENMATDHEKRMAKIREGSGADTVALEKDHRDRLSKIYTKEGRDKENARYKEAQRQLSIDDKETQAALAEEVQRYNDARDAAIARRAQRQADEDARDAITAKYASLRQKEQEAMEGAAAGQAAAAQQAALEAEEASYAARKLELEEALADADQDYIDEMGAIAAATQAAASKIKSAVNSINSALGRVGGGEDPQEDDEEDPGQNALGTSNWRGGLTWVGEREPELLNVPRGSSITPMSKMKSAGGNVYITNYFDAGSIRTDKDITDMVEEQRRSLRLNGGT